MPEPAVGGLGQLRSGKIDLDVGGLHHAIDHEVAVAGHILQCVVGDGVAVGIGGGEQRRRGNALITRQSCVRGRHDRRLIDRGDDRDRPPRAPQRAV